MLDFSLMLQVKLPVVNRIQPQSNKFAMGMESEATGVSKLNDSRALGSVFNNSWIMRTKGTRLSVDQYPPSH